MLKADIHLHAGEDKEDAISYSAKELVDRAAAAGFNVLAFTFHNKLYCPSGLKAYAARKGILLIPGIELVIEGKEVLIYNLGRRELAQIRTFDDLRGSRAKHKNCLVIAPHPFFPGRKCLGQKLIENIDLFDAIEISWFYSRWVDFNAKAFETAQKYSLPMVATSDCHDIAYFGRCFTKIDIPDEDSKDINKIISAIKRGRNTQVHSPLSLISIIWYSLKVIADSLGKKIR